MTSPTAATSTFIAAPRRSPIGAVFISSGHDEYVSGPIRTHVTAARDAGTNLIFFTGNEYFWKVRMEPSIATGGAADRTIVCYKESHAGAKIDPSPEWTGTWRDPRFSPPSDGGLPENELTGQLFRCIEASARARLPDRGALRVLAAAPVAQHEHRIAPARSGRCACSEHARLRVGRRRRQRLPPERNGPPVVDNAYLPRGPAGQQSHLRSRDASPTTSRSTGPPAAPWSSVPARSSGPSASTRSTTPTLARRSAATCSRRPSTCSPTWACRLAAASQTWSRPARRTDNIAPTSTITSPAAGATVPVGDARDDHWHRGRQRRRTGRRGRGLRRRWPDLEASDRSQHVELRVHVLVAARSSQHPLARHRRQRQRGGSQRWNHHSGRSAAPSGFDLVQPGRAACPVGQRSVSHRGRRSLPSRDRRLRHRPALLQGNGQHRHACRSSLDRDWSARLPRSRSRARRPPGGRRCPSIPCPFPLAPPTWLRATCPTATSPSTAATSSRPPTRSGPSAPSLTARTAPTACSATGARPSRPPASVRPTIGSTSCSTPTITAPRRSSTMRRLPTSSRSRLRRPCRCSSARRWTPPRSSSSSATRPTSRSPAPPATAPRRARATFTPATALAAHTTYTARLVAAKDSSGQSIAAPLTWSFTTTGAPGTVPTSIWDTSATPAVPVVNDSPVELGVKFRSDIGGTLTALRFYKAPGAGGPHVGHLWNAAGQLLATVTFANESASGWQQANLATPVVLVPGAVYVASYHAVDGRWALTAAYFNSSDADRGPIHAPRTTAVSGGNGVYRYGPGGGFPTATRTTATTTGSTSSSRTRIGPQVTDHEPARRAVAVSPTRPVPGLLRRAASHRRHSSSSSVMARPRAGTSAYDDASRSATLTPTAPLARNRRYTASVPVSDLTRQPHGPAPDLVVHDCGRCPADARHAVGHAGSPPDGGQRFFRSRARRPLHGRPDGVITGVRYYKGAGNVGPHVGRLWTGRGRACSPRRPSPTRRWSGGRRPGSRHRSPSRPARPTSPRTTLPPGATR